ETTSFLRSDRRADRVASWAALAKPSALASKDRATSYASARTDSVTSGMQDFASVLAASVSRVVAAILVMMASLKAAASTVKDFPSSVAARRAVSASP